MRKFSWLVALAAGAVLVIAPAAHADDTYCVGVLGPVVVDNVIVPEGGCTLLGTQVLGSVRVEPFSAVSIHDANVRGNVDVGLGAASDVRGATTIGGNWHCNGCSFVLSTAIGTRVPQIRGNLQVKGPSAEAALVVIFNTIIAGDLEISDLDEFSANLAVRGNSIGGKLKIADNRLVAVTLVDVFNNTVGSDQEIVRNRGLLFRIGDNLVGGNLRFAENVTAVGTHLVTNNRIRENLECFENAPPPVLAGNNAAKYEGQCLA